MARTPAITRNTNKVGDVIQSMLTEAQFQLYKDDTWILMDGRDVSGSDYAILLSSTTIPDARGQFLRAKNNGRSDGQENPTDGALGDAQTDSMQGHGHHIPSCSSQDGQGRVTAGASSTGSQSVDDASYATEYNSQGTPRTDTETRPKNITVNFFIKINE